MSLINITFDTKEKMVTCTVDGVDIPDVSHISIYKYCTCDGKEQCELCIESATKDEDSGIHYRKLMTANHLEAKAGIAEEIKDSNGLYAFSSSKQRIHEDISKMLKRG